MYPWPSRLLVPSAGITFLTMSLFEFKAWQMVVVLLSLILVFLLLMIFLAPGTRTEGFVESIKSRFR